MISGTKLYLQALILILLTTMVYIPAMRSDFIWDDNTFLTENKLIKKDDGLYRFWFTSEAPDYFPLVSTTLWFEWRLWGMDATGYHIVNILLHALSSLLTWIVLKQLRIPGAWLSALLFAVHPVNVESVAWITERKNTLPMIFYLATLHFYLRYLHTSLKPYYYISLFLFLAALLGKTSVVMLPIVLLLFIWWIQKTVTFKHIINVTPFFILSLLLGLVTIWFQYTRAIGSAIVRDDTFLSRFTIAGKAIWFYLYKALLPFNLSFVYTRWDLDAVTTLSFLPNIFLLLAFILFFKYRASWGRPALFALGYFIISLLPVLGFLDIFFMKYSLVADHWQYFSIIGVIAPIGALLYWLGTSSVSKINPIPHALPTIYVGTMTALCWAQQQPYQNRETLWRDTLSKNDTAWIAHENLGVILAGKGLFDQAISHYRKALAINPEHDLAHNNLGISLAAKGEILNAISHYNTALQIAPESDKYHNNLALALGTLGKKQEAIYHFREGLRINPASAQTHNNLGLLLEKGGETETAKKHFYTAIQIDPEYSGALNNLANTLMREGKTEEAISLYKKSLNITPDDINILYNMGVTLDIARRYKDSIKTYTTLLNINPNDAGVHNLIGQAFLHTGKKNRAMEHFQKAIAIRPDFQEARGNLLLLKKSRQVP